MAKKVKTDTVKTTAEAEAKPEKKQSKIVVSISQVFRNLAISVNMTVYVIYLLYLVYSIYADIGIRIIIIFLPLLLIKLHFLLNLLLLLHQSDIH